MNADKRGNARLSRGHHCAADWEQVEAADPAQPAGAPLAIQRAAQKPGGISQKVLTDSLRSMEEDGLVTRTVYPEVPPRVEYSLSPLGESMRPIIQAMEQWGAQYKASKAREQQGLSAEKEPPA